MRFSLLSSELFCKTALRAVSAIVISFVPVALSSQLLQEVQFPAPQQTSITDCVTPTTLTLLSGATLILKGGQFIHYKDAVFDGTVYASSSAAGCQRYPEVLDEIHRPVAQVVITFSQPSPMLELTAFNLLGQDQAIGVILSCGVGCGAGEGNEFLAFQMQTFFWPLPPRVGAIDSIWIQSLTLKEQPDFTHTPTEWSWALTSLKVLQQQPDRVFFDYASSGDDGKILMSTAPWDANYFSKYQVPGSPTRVKVSGTLMSGTTVSPKAGTVYLKVVDPADVAQYRGSDAQLGDNDGAVATLVSGTPIAGGATKIQADSQGRFEATLEIPSKVAGDNYQIEGAADQNFQCGSAGCSRSGVFTLWKRIYVEQESMFVSGSFLSDMMPAGTAEIFVADPTPFQNLSAGATLELVHGETASAPGYYSDFVTFASLRHDNLGRFVIDIDPASHPRRDYGEAPPPNGAPVNPVLGVMRDGVGIVAARTYEANDAYVAPLLGSMFVDIQPARQIVTEVPTVLSLGRAEQRYFAVRWFQDAAGSPYSRTANPNVLHRTVAVSSPLVPTAGGVGAELGATTVSGGTNYSLIFAKTITDLTAGAIPPFANMYGGFNAFLLNGETTAHETVHFWIHAGGSDGNGHCLQQSYQGTLNCLMHEPYLGPSLADGVVDLHYLAHGNDSEYMFMRRAPDPVPQQ